MESEQKQLEEGFSEDGFITDQNCFSSVSYRTMRAHINGCGWIAAYNLRRFLGQDVYWDDVRREMDGMHTFRVPGPTLMKVMRAYLASYVPEIRETVGREQALEAAERSKAGIFRYKEENVPHFVSYCSAENGLFRFFNVTDGLEDCLMTMDRFGKEHLLRGTVIALTVE